MEKIIKEEASFIEEQLPNISMFKKFEMLEAQGFTNEEARKVFKEVWQELY